MARIGGPVQHRTSCTWEQALWPVEAKWVILSSSVTRKRTRRADGSTVPSVHRLLMDNTAVRRVIIESVAIQTTGMDLWAMALRVQDTVLTASIIGDFGTCSS